MDAHVPARGAVRHVRAPPVEAARERPREHLARLNPRPRASGAGVRRAMKTEHRIYIALAILALLGVGVFMTQKKQKAELSEHSATAATADLPKIGVSKDDVEKITRITIKNADK